MRRYEAWLLAPDGTVLKRVPIDATSIGGRIEFAEPDFGMPLPPRYTVVQGRPAELAQAVLYVFLP